jgi:hypothetical protein
VERSDAHPNHFVVYAAWTHQCSVLGPCLDAPQKLEFFHSLSITLIFGLCMKVVNLSKKITNYTV